MKPETKQASPGFSLTVEVIITSGHRKHGSGTSQKFDFFLKDKSTACTIIDTLGIALLELQSQQSSRIPSCAAPQVLIVLLHLCP